MGLLDDAIREHLDLKRRRGADPADVARAEQEALGPVRREPAPADAADEEPHAHEPEQHEEPVAPEPEPVVEPTRGTPPEPVEEHRDEPDPRHDDIVHQPTTEFRVEDRHDDEDEHEDRHEDDEPAPPEDEDVLEETPDFLQETPEHDRLWFEQRPPRDFDFDG